ncbi:MAG: Rpn family recombination-promoting nuclease/putative transposase, partial [Chitinispirillales bacterium]|nr:Rpn family recombination-promoting nuclease/putative transposase [Chitinispirillales bacterium]
NQKHDEGYKSVLSDKNNFLHFLKKYIAEPWTTGIAASDLVRVDNSYVTSEYSNIDADLIYKLKTGGADVYFYVLVELQSQVDFTMPFRLLRYMVELLCDIFKNTDKNVRERKGFRLPAIVPIVLYNGDDNWTVVRTYREYTENYAIFGNNLIDFHYLLFDVKRTDDETILSTKKMLDIVFLLDKRRLENKTSPEEIEGCLGEHTANLPGDDALALFNWIKHVLYKSNLSSEEEQTFVNILKKGGGTVKHALEVWRDNYVNTCVLEGRQQGRQQGRHEGRLEGRLEGRHEEALKFANALKARGMDVNEIAELTGLTVDEIVRL